MAVELKAELDDIFDTDAERELLARILGAYYSAVLAAVHEVVRATFIDVPGFDPARFTLEDSATVRMLTEAGRRIEPMVETTRRALVEQSQIGVQRGYSTWQIAHGVPSEGYRGINGLYRETYANRAETIARTELQHAQRMAAVDRYTATGLVDEVELIDGDDWDATCANRNGRIVPLAQAPNLAHPRCTLVLLPVLRQGLAG